MIEESNMDLNSNVLQFNSNLSLQNSTIYFNSSSIIVAGCINISSSNIIVDVSSSLNNGDILLFNSTSGCLKGDSVNITFLNEPKCSILKTEMTTYSLYVIFIKQSTCGSTPVYTLEIVLITIGCIVGVALLTVVIILVVPSLRRKIFPYIY